MAYAFAKTQQWTALFQHLGLIYKCLILSYVAVKYTRTEKKNAQEKIISKELYVKIRDQAQLHGN